MRRIVCPTMCVVLRLVAFYATRTTATTATTATTSTTTLSVVIGCIIVEISECCELDL